MSLTIELPQSIERELESAAAANGQAPSELARDLLQDHLVRKALSNLNQIQSPKSLADLHPRQPIPPGSTPLREIVGKWPGDESDQTILAALEELS